MVRIVRQYKDEDLADVLSIWESASRISHPFLNNEYLQQERDNIPDVYLPNADTWVIENNEKIIGFIALHGHKIGGIFVQPEFQGTGAGRALLEKAQDLHDVIEIEIFKANSIGHGFFLNYGFKYLEKKIHDETGYELLRLRFTAHRSIEWSE